MSANVYGYVKGSFPKDERPKLAPGVELKDPPNAGLGRAALSIYSRPEWDPEPGCTAIREYRPDWTSIYFETLCKQDTVPGLSPLLHLKDVEVKPFKTAWMQTTGEWLQLISARMVQKMYFEPSVSGVSFSKAPSRTPGVHEAEVEAKIAAKKKANGTSRSDELVDDLLDGLKNFDKRREVVDGMGSFPDTDDRKYRVHLIDEFWLSRNGIWVNLKHPKLIDGVVVAVKDKDGNWEPVEEKTIRSQVENFMKRVHNAPALPKHPVIRKMVEAERKDTSAEWNPDTGKLTVGTGEKLVVPTTERDVQAVIARTAEKLSTTSLSARVSRLPGQDQKPALASIPAKVVEPEKNSAAQKSSFRPTVGGFWPVRVAQLERMGA